nr:MAG TPA: hypothetical protein [Caudoviricetes sp.]
MSVILLHACIADISTNDLDVMHIVLTAVQTQMKSLFNTRKPLVGVMSVTMRMRAKYAKRLDFVRKRK